MSATKRNDKTKVVCVCESQEAPGAGYWVRDSDGLPSFLEPARAAQEDLHTGRREH